MSWSIPSLFCIFLVFSQQCNCATRNYHLVSGAGIRTHILFIKNFLPQPLDRVAAQSKVFYILFYYLGCFIRFTYSDLIVGCSRTNDAISSLKHFNDERDPVLLMLLLLLLTLLLLLLLLLLLRQKTRKREEECASEIERHCCNRS